MITSHEDPTVTGHSNVETACRELTVEEAVAADAMNAAQSGSHDPAGAGGVAQAGAIPPQPVPLPQPLPIPQPIPIPIPILRKVSGRYRSPSASFQLELRVDVDGARPMRQISADFFQISGTTTSYFGSFVVKNPAITIASTTVTIKGLGQFTWSAAASVVQVTIARRNIFQPPAPALVQFFTASGSPGSTYNCSLESVYFRSVRLETDRVSDVTTPVFASYNTGSLSSGGPARNLSVVSAYAEAGIEMRPMSGTDVINIGEAGANTAWSNAELHASMVKHFSLWRDTPQWAVWQVVCHLHEMGSGLYGIMFDQQGKQRQGCAVFHAGIGGTTAEKLRLQLYTYVHELGHCFNLLHSWQKSYATPPGTNRPTALSWMNYPWNYPGGAAAFWGAFPFLFDDQEVAHLRHAFRNNIIMGGNDFAAGASLERTEELATPIQDDSGLQLEIAGAQSFALGEPVVVRILLRTTDTRGKTLHPHLHPNHGMVQVAIRKPSGNVVAYDPLIDHCIIPQQVRLEAGETLEESAYVGFGRDGLYFEEPGRYQVRAVYSAIDGSQVTSNILSVWVRYPVTAAEEDLARLFLGEEQGALLYLLGSDSDDLKRGNDAFQEVIEKHPKHRLAQYARLVKGINAGRCFKTVSDEKESRLVVRAANANESLQLLSAVTQADVLDPVSADMALSYLADCQASMGDKEGAKDNRAKARCKAARGTAALLVPASGRC